MRLEVEAHGGWAVVAGDIGPSGSILAPLGELPPDEAVAGFAEQAEALLSGGVDVIWIETMSDLGEIEAAIEGVRSVSSDVPVLATMTFDTRGRTMMGVSPEQAIQVLAKKGVAAAGGNCGNGPEEIVDVIRKMERRRQARCCWPRPTPVFPNWWMAGRCMRQGRTKWHSTRSAAAEAGAGVIGACCGSSPTHIRAMAQALGPKLAS